MASHFESAAYQGWKQLGVPTKITKADGVELDPGAVVREVLNDGDTVYVSHSLEPQDAERQD